MGPALAGEVVLVTGGARGIGRAVVDVAVQEGASVGIVDLDPGGHSVAEGFATAGHRVHFSRADVSNAREATSAVDEIAAALGTVTVLVNNAGRDAYFDPVAMTEDDWDAVFDVDLKAAWIMARTVLPAMIERGRGAVVNVASIHADLTMRGMFPYAAAKSGLVGLTRSLALDVAPTGIRVNAVSPGYVRTQLVDDYFAAADNPDVERDTLAMHPLGRIGTPEEIANVVCFLASSAASFVTGANWAVDGGLGIQLQ